MPQGGLAWFTEGDDQTVLGAADDARAAAIEALGDNPVEELLEFLAEKRSAAEL